MSGQFLEHDALMENVSHPGAFPAHPVQFIRMTAASDRYPPRERVYGDMPRGPQTRSPFQVTRRWPGCPRFTRSAEPEA